MSDIPSEMYLADVWNWKAWIAEQSPGMLWGEAHSTQGLPSDCLIQSSPCTKPLLLLDTPRLYLGTPKSMLTSCKAFETRHLHSHASR